MTPKEEARELVYKYSHLVTSWDCYWDTEIPIENRMEQMKECALIAVEKVILNCYEEEEYYWREVKQEIEKL